MRSGRRVNPVNPTQSPSSRRRPTGGIWQDITRAGSGRTGARARRAMRLRQLKSLLGAPTCVHTAAPAAGPARAPPDRREISREVGALRSHRTKTFVRGARRATRPGGVRTSSRQIDPPTHPNARRLMRCSKSRRRGRRLPRGLDVSPRRAGLSDLIPCPRSPRLRRRAHDQSRPGRNARDRMGPASTADGSVDTRSSRRCGNVARGARRRSCCRSPAQTVAVGVNEAARRGRAAPRTPQHSAPWSREGDDQSGSRVAPATRPAQNQRHAASEPRHSNIRRSKPRCGAPSAEVMDDIDVPDSSRARYGPYRWVVAAGKPGNARRGQSVARRRQCRRRRVGGVLIRGERGADDRPCAGAACGANGGRED